MKAAIPYGTNGWYLDTRPTAILAAEDPIFVDSMDELETILLSRHPCDDPRLVSVKVSGNVAYVYNPPFYAGKDVQEFLSMLEEKGTLSTGGDWDFSRQINEHPGYKVNFKSKSSYGGDHYIWDPVGIAKDKRKQHQHNLKQHIRSFELQRVIEALKAKLPDELRLVQTVTEGRISIFKCIYGLTKVYNLLHGKNAHRANPVWQTFIKDWRSRREKTIKEFTKLKTFELTAASQAGNSNQSWADLAKRNASTVQSFIDWVEKEAKRRLPPQKDHTKSEDVFSIK